jgi:hypothetical protein
MTKKLWLVAIFVLISVYLIPQPFLNNAFAQAPNASPNPKSPTNNTANNTLSSQDLAIITKSIFNGNVLVTFIIINFLIIFVPLVFDLYFAYTRKPTQSTEKEGGRIAGMPGLYRALMTYGIIILVGTVIFFLLALIFVNINNPQSSMLASLIDLLKNLGTILGTALATIIAFYFGMRGAESAAEKAVASTKLATGKEPPKVLSTSPPNGGKEVAPNSLVTATFSEPMNTSTVTEDTFTVKKEGDTNPLPGKVSLGPDAKTASFDADSDFEPNKKYIATIDIGTKDLKGSALASAKSWSFTTAEKVAGAAAATSAPEKEQPRH